jgi:hypothetical protein
LIPDRPGPLGCDLGLLALGDDPSDIIAEKVGAVATPPAKRLSGFASPCLRL